MGRKMLRDQGQAMRELIEEMSALLPLLDGDDEDIAALAPRFSAALDALQEATDWYLQNAASDPDLGSAVGVDYMMLVGNLACAWLMARAALAAARQLDGGSSDDYYRHKIKTARFFAEHILPRSEAQRVMVMSGSASVMSIDADSF